MMKVQSQAAGASRLRRFVLAAALLAATAAQAAQVAPEPRRVRRP